jgi:hypothetical protein
MAEKVRRARRMPAPPRILFPQPLVSSPRPVPTAPSLDRYASQGRSPPLQPSRILSIGIGVRAGTLGLGADLSSGWPTALTSGAASPLTPSTGRSPRRTYVTRASSSRARSCHASTDAQLAGLSPECRGDHRQDQDQRGSAIGRELHAPDRTRRISAEQARHAPQYFKNSASPWLPTLASAEAMSSTRTGTSLSRLTSLPSAHARLMPRSRRLARQSLRRCARSDRRTWVRNGLSSIGT